MLLVSTKIMPSPIQGLGLFADEFIPAGTMIWRFTPDFDRRFTATQIYAFPPALQAHLCRYAWKSRKSGLYCFAADNGKYFNHAATPNARSEYRDGEEEVVTITLRDIHPDEEITDDYACFEDAGDPDNILGPLAKTLGLIL